jgi:hypothetical protein
MRPLLLVTAGAAGTAALGYSLVMTTERFHSEQPAYQVLGNEGPIQVRSYPPRILVMTEVSGQIQEAKNTALYRLAGYISGGNSSSRRISMTAPVEIEEAEALRMSSFMPSNYRLEELPTPRDERVRLERAPARTVAVLRFRGRVTDKRVRRMTGELLLRVRQAGWEVEGVPVLAQYDGPFTLPFLRRTEVMVQLKPTSSSSAA